MCPLRCKWKSVSDNVRRRCPGGEEEEKRQVECFPLIPVVFVAARVYMQGPLRAQGHERSITQQVRPRRPLLQWPLSNFNLQSSCSRHGGCHLHPGRRVQELRWERRLRQHPEQGGVPQAGGLAAAQLRQGRFLRASSLIEKMKKGRIRPV